ncbi:putative FBD-associated F-box protein At5g50270 [Lolium perenne]|uniref:putative FBD-associated F-box protein At5g50270 n=1 Tax=Lolium perenne TaxID=4522 RepID=UPI003A999226
MPPLKRPKNEEEIPTASEVDRISDLPEGVLHHLLSLMPAHDAVRTCVLAHTWRHLWMSVPAIRFTNDESYSFGCANRLIRFVDRVLLLLSRRQGAPLHSCDFHLEEDEVLSNGYLAANEGRFSRWIWRALRLRVRVLRFHLGFDHSISLPDMPLLSDHLTTLELQFVTANESVLDFSGCPTLVHLIMELCYVNSTNISSSSLKHLQMIRGTFQDNHRTRVSLPNLVSLELDEVNGRIPLLESMPSLETAIVRIGDDHPDTCEKGGYSECGDDACEGCHGSDDDPRTHGVLLGTLLRATDLELSADPDMFVFKRDLKWCSTFTNLKTLVLSGWFLIDDLRALTWFLQRAPVLEKLTLQISKVHKIPEGTAGRYAPIEQSVASDHLELVEIKCWKVDEMVGAILKILNDSRIPLEKIQIHKYSSFGCFKFVCTDFNPDEVSGYSGLLR